MKPYYEDSRTVIYHGDCRDVLPELDPVELVLTDPPYGVGYWNHSKPRETITNDSVRISLALYRQVVPLLKAEHVLWFTRWDVWPDVWPILGQHFPIRGLLVWEKPSPGMGDLTHWGMSYELIASAGKGKLKRGRGGSVLRHNPVPPSRRRHPNQKPGDLLCSLVENLQPKTVLDPFMGSGATLMAARQNTWHERVIGIEIDEGHCEAAATWLSGTTAEVA